MSRLELVVTAVTTEAVDIVAVTMAAPNGAELPPWQPGAHVELRLPSGLSRQYSLCGDPRDRHRYTIAVLKDPASRGGSVELHALARIGVHLDVREPKNDFPLVEADSYLFLAGGIGITPMLAMLERAEAAGATWSLVYGGREHATMAYRDRLSRYGEKVTWWLESERGYPDLPTLLKAAPAGTVVYTCGPSAMIDAVAAEHTRHTHLGGLHFERFSASGPIDTSGDTFEVLLQRSGRTLSVPDGVPILEVVRRELPDQPFSCEEGYCGECETRVVAGEPDHRDDYLSPAEQDSGDVMMICVSRSKSERLVLDL